MQKIYTIQRNMNIHMTLVYMLKGCNGLPAPFHYADSPHEKICKLLSSQSSSRHPLHLDAVYKTTLWKVMCILLLCSL